MNSDSHAGMFLSSQLRSPPNRSIGTLSIPQYLTMTFVDIGLLAFLRHHNYIPSPIIVQALIARLPRSRKARSSSQCTSVGKVCALLVL